MFCRRSPRGRTTFSGIAVALVLPAAALLAPGAGADPSSAEAPGIPVVEAALGVPPEAPVGVPAEAPVELAAAVPVALVHPSPRLLPPARVSEQGLQIKTVLAARSISADFPQIGSMIGVRPDAKQWHPSGRALDVMIPDPGSAAGIALGDEIVAYALKHADSFGLQDVIWRGVYYTPDGPSASGYGHFDHVHITTTGGGYPSGSEEYFAD